VSTLIY